MARKKILILKDNIRLSVVHHVYKNKTFYTKMPDGELIPERRDILRKEMTLQKWFKMDGLTSVEEYMTQTNKVAKSRSIIFDKYSQRAYITFHSPEEIVSTMYTDIKQTIGFKK